MDRLIYTAMTGAGAAANRQAILSSNLANASTNGFRAQLETYRAVPLNGEGSSTRVFAVEATAGFLDTPGMAQQTNRSLDAMTTDKSWFAVQGLDGNEAYTRAGSLQTNPEGQLVTLSGLPVVGDGGPIQIPANANVEISGDGIVTTQVGNGRPQQAGRLKLVTPETPMLRGTDGLFRASDAGDLTQDPTARLQSGSLEGSNVSPIETMVAMISAARQFEQQMKSLQGAEQREQSASKLLGPQ